MQHFSELVWADHVRGISSSNCNVESHLASGCNACAATLGMWKEVSMFAARECNYIPPENAARMAKLEFAATRVQDNASALTANLVFDTLSQPALAGVRSVAAAARQMVYEADGVTVDLRFDRQPHSNTIHLIGQVLDRRVPRVSLGHTAVMLWTERGLPILETRTNEFGEFNLEIQAEDHLKLSIQAVGGTIIRIPLTNLKLKYDADAVTDSNR
jgi:hypothetical protein